MKGDIFIKWTRTALLPGLRRKTILILHNVKYYHTMSAGTFKLPMKKQELQAVLNSHGVAFDPRVHLAELADLFIRHVQPKLQTELEQVTEQERCKVLYLPPSHPELPAIELGLPPLRFHGRGD